MVLPFIIPSLWHGIRKGTLFLTLLFYDYSGDAGQCASHVSEQRHIEGTGLGLSIVHQLVELMGDEISVNSIYTKGSKFIVMLEQDIVDEKELVRLNEDIRQSEIEKDILIFEQAKRRSLLVTTDSVCDLPESLRKEFGISVCPYYVCTDAGRFLDEQELNTDELLVHLSSSLGLMVLCAAYMAEHHAAKAEVVAAVKRLGRFISSAFIIDSTHMMCQSGRISKKVQVLCDALLLHPVLVLRKSKMVVGSIVLLNGFICRKHLPQSQAIAGRDHLGCCL